MFPASAEPRTLNVTLLGGTVIQVTVDVPPGTPLDQIVIPGVTLPIVSITEAGGPAPAPPAEAAAPGATGGDGASGASGSTGPDPGDIPQAAPQQGEQETTGKSDRRPKADKKQLSKAEKVEEAKQTEALGKKAKAKAAEEKATAARDEDGTPTAVNPTYSFAIPGGSPIGVPNFFIEKFRIPPFLLPIYQAAGIQYGIRWEILAAINEIETDYGRNLNVSSAGALGWMQFIPSTWKAYGVDANNDGKKDPYNPVDAIFGAARYLKAAGAEKDISKAIFAYNHAQWYVDSVLMRARLIGGLPADLVGSLTGLTQGHFPVFATARYADDLSEADTKRRIARGKNAAIPVEAQAARKGIDIFAKAGSPVIAVQDATVVRVGSSKRLGKFVQIRDVYGNLYTYGGLKKVASAYPVPKERKVTKAEVAKELDLPRDAAPARAASAGTQKQATSQLLERGAT
ncbi:MAG: lytic murein transglycosylase, partial [Gemmatimonadetes bacterium]|nr:lytic murein transglycosylase [Gemmatimonadota bacterium]